MTLFKNRQKIFFKILFLVPKISYVTGSLQMDYINLLTLKIKKWLSVIFVYTEFYQKCRKNKISFFSVPLYPFEHFLPLLETNSCVFSFLLIIQASRVKKFIEAKWSKKIIKCYQNVAIVKIGELDG